jgi:hypothetical protein
VFCSKENCHCVEGNLVRFLTDILFISAPLMHLNSKLNNRMRCIWARRAVMDVVPLYGCWIYIYHDISSYHHIIKLRICRPWGEFVPTPSRKPRTITVEILLELWLLKSGFWFNCDYKFLEFDPLLFNLLSQFSAHSPVKYNVWNCTIKGLHNKFMK